ncbi:putative disease resistance protein [Cardamine amara subsp. amara]|uniref:Disease resistance protein n=1 Tax=Cardamine amara subsp. amara TaxID=228776 RepID=A0ABD1BF28_CARAN
MAVTDFFVGEIATELLKQLVFLSAKACRYKGTAENLIALIEDVQPTIKEIQFGGVELPAHRQAQIRMLSETLEKGRKLTENCLSCRRWNVGRQLYLSKKMEKLEKTIAAFFRGPILTNILADVHLLRANSDVRWDRVDRNLEIMNEQLGSMKIGGGGMITDALKLAEAMEIETTDDLEKFGVGLELGKTKVKKMMFNSNGGIFGISGMGGVGKTTLARELERDDQVQRHFENRILFLTVSQSPILEELRARIWYFVSGCESANPVPDSNFQFEGQVVQTRKLVILDDVWTTQALDRLTSFKIPGCTTLVVSRSKLTEPKSTYDVEVLTEDEAISLFCLCAFGQKSVPSGFCKNLVKQVASECKGLPLALKVTGASLKEKPEKYWEGVLQRLSRGEPADETHESRLLHQMEASLENLDPTTKECFLDLGAFPEDRKIPLDVLINMWIEIHDIEEGTAFAILVDLSHKNLLTLGKDPRLGSLYASHYDIFVTQHDVLRDLALHISNVGKVNRRKRLLMPKRESELPREWERNNDDQYIAQIVSIHTGQMNEMEWFDMEFPKAEILILNFSSDKYVLPPFITKMNRLRVLVIINNGMSPAVLHDFSIFANLSKLRSLWLERVHVPDLSNTTVPLKNLNKMSLILCKINNSFNQTGVDVANIFPKLGDLTIDHCDDLVALPSSICRMMSLNCLSITNCPRLGALPKNLSKLQGLELLRLYACPELEALPVEICELHRLKYIDISQCVSLSCLPEKIGKLKKLEKIDMRECCFSDRPSSAVSLESLRHVICDTDVAFMWDEVKKAVPGLKIEAAEKCFSLDWLDE